MFDNALSAQRRIVAVFALGLFFLASATILFWESRPFFLPRSHEARFFEEFAAANGFFGVSTYSRHLAMRECYTGLDRIRASGAVTPEKYAFIDTCRRISGEAVTSVPPFSLGWLTAAYGAIGRLDAAAFNDHLAMAYKTASHEQWLAEKRAELAENNFGWLSADNLKRHKADLQLLAKSYVGSEFLATRYNTDPLFRERVVAVVEKLPQEDQKRFLWNVRRLARPH